MALTYDQINAITEKKFLPKLTDNIFQSTPLMRRLSRKMRREDGGTSVMVPLNYAQTSAVGWYSGADTLDNTDNEVITSAEFDWAQIYASVSITRRDELVNRGDAQKINFVKSKLKIAEKSLKDTIAGDLYNAGTNAKAIVGAQTFVNTSSTYGGIDQSSYSWWQGNVDSSTTTLTIAALQSLWGSISINGESPTVCTATQSNFDRYYALLQPQQRFMDDDTAKGGFASLMFNGVPFIADSKVPTGDIYMFNENYLHMIMHKDESFRMEPFQNPINQNVKVAHIFAMMVLASDNNRMHGALTALTA